MSTLSAQPAAVDGAVELGDGLAVVGTAVVGAGVVGARSFDRLATSADTAPWLDRTLVPSMHVYGSTKHACNGVGPHFGARELLHHAVDVLGVGVAAGRIAGPFSAPRNVPSTATVSMMDHDAPRVFEGGGGSFGVFSLLCASSQ